MTLYISKDVEVEYLKTSDIKIRFRLRTPKETRVQELAESIKMLGLLHPITVDNNNYLVCGYHRKLAFEKLGIEEIPIIRKDYRVE